MTAALAFLAVASLICGLLAIGACRQSSYLSRQEEEEERRRGGGR